MLDLVFARKTHDDRDRGVEQTAKENPIQKVSPATVKCPIFLRQPHLPANQQLSSLYPCPAGRV